jgi:hypothetical protein
MCRCGSGCCIISGLGVGAKALKSSFEKLSAQIPFAASDYFLCGATKMTECGANVVRWDRLRHPQVNMVEYKWVGGAVTCQSHHR